MGIDILTAGAGIISFAIFLLVHVITFRWLRPEALLKSLRICALSISVLPVALMVVFFAMRVTDASAAAWVLASLSALLITGLLSFVYITCFFGPYETSIRMRLIREIARGPLKGISLPELLETYSARTIVDIRLRRLMGSGDIVKQNGTYRTGNSNNVFLVFDIIAKTIKKWIE